jgi:mannitol-1-/sugar-/sorbitol-6-phosphatase
MIKVRTKGLLFDMDGVLISSLGSVERSWQTWQSAMG